MSKVSNRAQLAKKIGLSDTDLEELFSYFDTDGSGNVEPVSSNSPTPQIHLAWFR